MNEKLKKLFFKGANFLGVNLPIMGGAMTWVSENNLVSATSNAGGFGVIAAGSMSPDMLEKEIIYTKQKTTKPFWSEFNFTSSTNRRFDSNLHKAKSEFGCVCWRVSKKEAD